MARAHRRLAEPRRARILPLRVPARVGCTRAGSAPPPARRAPRSRRPSPAVESARRRGARNGLNGAPPFASVASRPGVHHAARLELGAQRVDARRAQRRARRSNCAAVATPPESFSRSRAVTGHATRGEPSARSLLRRRARAPTAGGAAAASARRSQSTPSHSWTDASSSARSSPRDRSRVITWRAGSSHDSGCAACSLTTNCLSSAACRDAAHPLLRPSARARSSSRAKAASTSLTLDIEVPLAVGVEDGMPRLPREAAQLSPDDRSPRRPNFGRELVHLDCAAVRARPEGRLIGAEVTLPSSHAPPVPARDPWRRQTPPMVARNRPTSPAATARTATPPRR